METKINDEIVRAILCMLFGYEDYVTMYEVIDNDMIRKPAIAITKRKTRENGDNEFLVRINWRLLDQAIENPGGAK